MVSDSDAVVVLLGSVLYLCAALASLRIARELLGPEPELVQPRLWVALAGTARGLAAGVRHLAEPGRRTAAWALASMTLMRFCYGALTVMVLMLCRYAWSSDSSGAPDSEQGLALLGLAVGISGAGFFTAAVITPWAAGRLGPGLWIVTCSAAAALLEPALGLPFAQAPLLIAAFVVGLISQGAKISTDTIVQSSVDDGYRGRIFSLYDVLFNVAFVGAAAVAALMLPPDGRSAALVITVAVIYGLIAAVMARFGVARRRRCGGHDVSRETSPPR